MTVWNADRLRAIGWVVLAAGVGAAGVYYWAATAAADATLDDSTALGYRRSFDHQMGVMMGHFGQLLTTWQEWLSSPIGRAAMIAVGAAIVAGCFFRVAWLRKQEEPPAP
jgi:hypothetical protein